MDGTFAENERIAFGLSVLIGLKTIPFTAPGGIAFGETYARLRVSTDDQLTPLDVLVVINALNRLGNGEGEDAVQANLEVEQAVVAISRETQQSSPGSQVWSDLDWLWHDQNNEDRRRKNR